MNMLNSLFRKQTHKCISNKAALLLPRHPEAPGMRSPLTRPSGTLSPLRGEGESTRRLRRFDRPRTWRYPQRNLRRRTTTSGHVCGFPDRSSAVPSPLNGERVRARGENHHWRWRGHNIFVLFIFSLLVGCSPPKEAESHAGHDHAHQEATETSDAATGVVMCAEHAVPLAECGICKPELIASLQSGQSLKVRLPAAESARLAGVQTAAATNGPIAEGMEAYAEIEFNQNKLAQIVAPVSGIIQAVEADLGSKVQENQVVAKIWSASIAEAVAKAVLTHQTLERERKLRAERVTSEKDLQQAEAEHRASCQQLRTLGFTEEQIDALGARPQESVLLEVRAPFAGEIVERTAVRGALVELGRPLFTLADRTTMWAMLNIPETALARVRTGQRVELRVDSLPDQTFTGTLTWIGAEIDERSRMARARVEVSNPDEVLKAKMYAQARILTRTNEGALVLPTSAIQRVASKPFVFVQLADDLFEARAVRTGATFNGEVEIRDGVKPGEQVVVNHGFSVKSQLLISRLGAGCADD